MLKHFETRGEVGAAFSTCFLDISPRRLIGWGDPESWFWTTVFQDLSVLGSPGRDFPRVLMILKKNLEKQVKTIYGKKFMNILPCHHVIICVFFLPSIVISTGYLLVFRLILGHHVFRDPLRERYTYATKNGVQPGQRRPQNVQHLVLLHLKVWENPWCVHL